MGFDNGTLQGGVFFQAKQFGSILRGFGPPVPQAGVVGDLYMDTQTFNLYEKRASDETDPWGHFLFVVPVTYQSTLKWFTASQITDDIGQNGDYALLWAGFGNYGLQPSIFGPKANGSTFVTSTTSKRQCRAAARLAVEQANHGDILCMRRGQRQRHHL